jgi:BirA family biotin operon repressor/biotin-[acetyl-CoA-carboxylase] ligase
MALLRGIKFDRGEVLERFMQTLATWYAKLERGAKTEIEEYYSNLMYHLNEPHTYALPSGEEFTARIRGVRSSGELRLEHADGTIREYAFKEVEFVLRAKKR